MAQVFVGRAHPVGGVGPTAFIRPIRTDPIYRPPIIPFQHVQGAGNTGGVGITSLALTLPAAPRPGDLVVVALVSSVDISASLVVTDANSNAYTVVSAAKGGGTPAFNFFAYLPVAPSNASATINMTFASTTIFASFGEEFYLTAGAVAAYDSAAANSGSGNSTLMNLPVMTPTFPNSLAVVVGGAGGNVTAPTAGSQLAGWTGGAGGNPNGNGFEYSLSVSGSITTQIVQTTGTWAASGIAFFTVPPLASPILGFATSTELLTGTGALADVITGSASLPGSGAGSPSFVQFNEASGANPMPQFTNPTVAGNTYVVCASVNLATGEDITGPPTDTEGNPFVQRLSTSYLGSVKQIIWDCIRVKGGTLDTVTVPTTVGAMSVVVQILELNNALFVDVCDQQGTTGATVSSPNINTRETNELLIGIGNQPTSANSFSAYGAGWTGVILGSEVVQYQNVSSIGLYSSTATQAVSTDSCIMAILGYAATERLAGVGALADVIAGSAAIVAGGSAIAAAASTIAGTSAVTAALTGVGALADIITGTSAVAALLKGTGALADVITGTATVSAPGTGFGALADVITGSSSVSGPGTGFGALADVITGSASVVALLAGTGALADIITGSATLSAPGRGFGALADVITGSASTSGPGTGFGALADGIFGTSVVVAGILQPGLVAAIVGGASVTALLTGTGALADAITGSASVSGPGTGQGALADVITGTATASPLPSGVGALADVIAGVGIVTALGTAAGSGAIVASIFGTSNFTANLGQTIFASADIHGGSVMRDGLIDIWIASSVDKLRSAALAAENIAPMPNTASIIQAKQQACIDCANGLDELITEPSTLSNAARKFLALNYIFLGEGAVKVLLDLASYLVPDTTPTPLWVQTRITLQTSYTYLHDAYGFTFGLSTPA